MIYNFFYSSEFKNSNENNNDFNIILDENIVINETDKAFIKINNISFLNNMFNISSYHNNNYIDITHDAVLTRIYIPDGNYNVYTLRDKLNTLLHYAKITITYDTLDFTYSFITQNGTALLDPCNLKNFLGVYFPFTVDTNIQWGSKIDFRSYNKIIITSSLTLKNNPYNNLISSYSSSSGMGSILCWINRNEIPYSTINYNNEDLINEIEDKNIKNINFKIYNEYREEIKDLSDIQIQFQIIVKENKIINKLINRLSKIKLLSNIR